MAQSPDRIQAAKKEGEFAVFGTLENDVASSEIMANVGEFVNRRGISPPIAGADHVSGKFVQMISMTAKNTDQRKKNIDGFLLASSEKPRFKVG